MTTFSHRRKRPLLLLSEGSSFSVGLLLLLLCLVVIHQFALAPLPVVQSFAFQRSSISPHRSRPKMEHTRPSMWLSSSLRDDYESDDAAKVTQGEQEGLHWMETNEDNHVDTSITSWEQEQQEQDLTSERMRERRQMTKRRTPVVGDPQLRVKEKERSVTSILKELAAIQQQGPQKYCILGTRHCSYLHQQIIELLAYALVLSGNHVYTSGAGGTHAATIRGALRAERPDLLTVVLPQSLSKQTKESQELLHKVKEIVAMPNNDELSLDMASRICNSYLLSQTDQLIAFAFHESTTVIEATKEAKTLDMLVTVLFLD